MNTEPFYVEESNNATMTVKNRISQEWFKKRYLLAGALCFGFFSLFSLNMTTSLVLIEMTKNRTIMINGTVHYEPEFDWSSEKKGWILSAYAYGMLSSFLVTWMVKKLGGVTSNGLTLFISGIIYVSYPFIVRSNFYFYLTIRVIEGILQTIGYLSAFEIWSNWAPKKERSKLLAIHFTGSHIANVVTFPISGYFAYIWQWPAAYYFTGGMAIFASCIILLLFSNDPSTDRYISETERKYLIQEVQKSPQDKVTYPWKDILTSRPLWALFVMKFSFVCGLTFVVLCLPHYIKDLTNIEIHKIGILSGIPNVLGVVAIPLFGWLADYIQNNKLLNVTQVHKIYTFGGLVLAAGCIFVIALLRNTTFTINIVLLILFKVLLSLSDLITKFAPLYMAPNHSSLVASMVSYGYFLGSLLIPMLMGYVVTSHDPYEWTIVLLSLGTILLAGGLIFIFFGSSETQPWSRPTKESNREPNVEKLLQ